MSNINDFIIEDGVLKKYVRTYRDAVIPEAVTTIGETAFLFCAKLTLHGKADSYAETYAKKNNIPFVAE